MEPCRQNGTINLMKVSLNSLNCAVSEQAEALEEIKNRVDKYAVILEELRNELTGNYSPSELKATLDFFVSLGRVFIFFQRYKIFSVALSLMFLSAVSGVGIIDIVNWMKEKGFWFN